MKSGFKGHETSWLYAFEPNESDGTKFGQCFFIGLGLSESFARTLLGENGYFIGFWHFRPNSKLLWCASKWTLCLQKCWILLIYYVVRLQIEKNSTGFSNSYCPLVGHLNHFDIIQIYFGFRSKSHPQCWKNGNFRNTTSKITLNIFNRYYWRLVLHKFCCCVVKFPLHKMCFNPKIILKPLIKLIYIEYTHNTNEVLQLCYHKML